MGKSGTLGKTNKVRKREREREREREPEPESQSLFHPLPGIVPSLETFENVMKVSQMVVQGMWSRGSNSCLFQMPHITADQVKQIRKKKVTHNMW